MKLPRRFDRRRRKLAREAVESLSFQDRFIIDTVSTQLTRHPRLVTNGLVATDADCVLVQYVKSVSPKGRSIKTDSELRVGSGSLKDRPRKMRPTRMGMWCSRRRRRMSSSPQQG